MQIQYTADFSKALLIGNKALQEALLMDVALFTGKPTFIQGPRFGYAISDTSVMYVSKVIIS